MMKTTILLDMYGVILKESKGNFITYTYKFFAAGERERLTKLFREDQLFTKTSNGDFTSDSFLTQLGFSNPQFHMADYLDNYLTLDEGFVSFAEHFANQFEMVLLSNDVSEWSTYITEHHNLDRFFAQKIVSGDVHCRKPDRKIFEIALERIRKKPEECLFVDNSVKNLMTAKELGIKPILFNRDNEDFDGTTIFSFAELAALISLWIKTGNLACSVIPGSNKLPSLEMI